MGLQEDIAAANIAERDRLKTKLDRLMPGNSFYSPHVVANAKTAGPISITPFDSDAVIAAKVAAATEATNRNAAIAALYPSPSERERVATAAKALLSTATLWLDAEAYDTSTPQILKNLGTGGSALDARLGSTTGVDTNDPQYLPFDGTPYIALPGISGNYLSVPDAAPLRITGDLDICVRLNPATWTPAAAQYLVARRAAAGNASYWLALTNTGTIQLVGSSDGTATTGAAVSGALGFTNGQAGWVRVTRAAGGAVAYYVAPDSPFVPAAWTPKGTSTLAGAFFAGTSALEIGSVLLGTAGPLAGSIHRVQIRNNILDDGTGIVLDVDTAYVGSGGATSFLARTGQTVTINRSTSGRKTSVVTSPKFLFGTDDYMEVPHNSLLDPGTGSFTALSIHRQFATNANFGVFASKRDATTLYGWGFWNSGTALTLGSNVTTSTLAVPLSDVNRTLNGALAVVGVAIDANSSRLHSITDATLSTNGSTTGAGAISSSRPLRVGADSQGVAASFVDMAWRSCIVFRRLLSVSELALIAAYYKQEMP